MQYRSASAEDTIEIGKQIAPTLVGGDIVLMSGDLGAGKTTLMKGILSYFGVKPETVVSPTFTLLQEYQIEQVASAIKTLVHIDTYRMKEEEELFEIGIDEYLDNPTSIIFIEWPEKLETICKNRNSIVIQITHGQSEERIILVEKKTIDPAKTAVL